MKIEPELCRVDDALDIISREMETNYFIAFIERRYTKIQ